MPATTVTSIVMVLFAIGLIAMAVRNLFGAWEPLVRHEPVPDEEAEIQAAILEMRRAIADYERQQRSP